MQIVYKQYTLVELFECVLVRGLNEERHIDPLHAQKPNQRQHRMRHCHRRRVGLQAIWRHVREIDRAARDTDACDIVVAVHLNCAVGRGGGVEYQRVKVATEPEVEERERFIGRRDNEGGWRIDPLSDGADGNAVVGRVGFDRVSRVGGEIPGDVGQVVVGADKGDGRGVIQGTEVFVLPGLLAKWVRRSKGTTYVDGG